MPELMNCKRCNKVFSFIAGLPICPSCIKEDEIIYDALSRYIREHPGVSLKEVSKELKISYDKIMKYIREGRLQIRAANGQYIKYCEKCGTETANGRFCEACEGHIMNVLDTSKRTLQGKIEVGGKNKSDYRFLAADNKKK